MQANEAICIGPGTVHVLSQIVGVNQLQLGLLGKATKRKASLQQFQLLNGSRKI